MHCTGNLETTIENERFWQYADDLVAASEIMIDRTQGSSHPRYPDVRYPLDYGFLRQTKARDGSGMDVWLGSLPERHVTGAIVTIDTLKRDAEVKLLISCTRKETQQALDCHTQGQQAALLLRREAGTGTESGEAEVKDVDSR